MTAIDNSMQGRYVTEYKTEKIVEVTIADEILERFERAKSAPIFKGSLLELLGYSADTITTTEILEGMFKLP